MNLDQLSVIKTTSSVVSVLSPGDAMVEKATKEFEILPVSLLWEAADWYKKAILLTREKEVGPNTKAND